MQPSCAPVFELYNPSRPVNCLILTLTYTTWYFDLNVSCLSFDQKPWLTLISPDSYYINVLRMSFGSKIHPYNTRECQCESQTICSASLFIHIDLRIHWKSTTNGVRGDHTSGSGLCRCAAGQLSSRGEGIMMLECAAHLQIPQGTPSRKHILCQKSFTMATLSQSDCV